MYGDGWADVIDLLTMDPDALRKVFRMLARSTRRTSLSPSDIQT